MRKRLPLWIAFLALTLFGCKALMPAQPATPAALTPPPATQAVTPGAETPTAAPQAPATLPAPPEVTMANPGAPEVAAYAISVRLDPPKHQITASQTITYTNTLDQPMPDLVFHLYLNGFKSEDTIFMREAGGAFRGDVFNPENNGWIEVHRLSVAGGEPLDLQLLEDGTLARAELPEPLAPGASITLTLDFTAQLPQVFARTGWALDAQGDPFFLVGQWFPKLGVWTDDGWNAYPFHGNAEFFADFGSYAVAISVPEEYVTGATGVSGPESRSADGWRTDFYSASGVIDFAWTASPNLETRTRKAGGVQIDYLYLPEHDWSADRVLDAAQRAITYFGQAYGAYPYPRLTVVDVPDAGAGAGGMEYPMFITAGAEGQGETAQRPNGWVDYLEIVTVHEAAHQWWQSTVATNEAEEPWLDEGFTEYSTARLLSEVYGLDEQAMRKGDFPPGLLQGRRSRYLRNPGVPMLGRAWEFRSWDDYVVAAYAKPVVSLLTLERVVGEPVMREILATYYLRYQFAHPTTADFRAVAEEVTGQPLDWFFDGLVETGETLNYSAEAISGSSITAAREGDLIIPTTIRVQFANGKTQDVPWDGAEEQRTFTFNQPVKSFTIDPDLDLLVDLDWTDNSLVKQ